MEITTAARRLTLQHNNADDLIPGYIYEINLATGEIGECISSYAAKQHQPDHIDYGRYAFLRISNGRLTQKDAQAFINAKGQGW